MSSEKQTPAVQRQRGYAANIEKTIRHLSVTIGPRAPGSEEERVAAEYLHKEFTAAGLDTVIEPFESASHRAVRSSVVINGQSIESLPTQFSPGGGAQGPLVFLGTGLNMLVDYKDVAGKIGLITPAGNHVEKTCYLLELEAAGLAGLVIVSQYLDTLQTKQVRYPDVKKMPMAVVSWRNGVALKRRVGEVASLSVELDGPDVNESRNVVATIPGSGDYWLAVTSHFDSAAFAPGALDDASGTSVLLETARLLAAGPTPAATIVLVASGSEEHGCVDSCGAGAQAFFNSRADQLEKCIVHVEIDDVGNVLGNCRLYTGGSMPLRDSVLSIPTDLRYTYMGKHNVSCDHGAAEQRGIPYVWMIDAMGIGESAHQPIYHSPEDTVEFVDFAFAAQYVEFLRDIILKLSTCGPFLPCIRSGKLLIRPARHADITAVMNITKRTFGPVSTDRMRQDYFGEKLGGQTWDAYKIGDLKRDMENNIFSFLVCEIEGRVVGYASYMYDEKRGLAEIGNNAVDPDFQKRGIGTALQEALYQRMRDDGYTNFTVSTLAVDAPAQRMYEKQGYEKFAESYHYLKKG